MATKYDIFKLIGLVNLLKQLEANEDLEKDLDDLKKIGLSKEELEGYKEFYIENYYIDSMFSILNKDK